MKDKTMTKKTKTMADKLAEFYDKAAKKAMGIKHSPTREELLAFAISRRESCSHPADCLGVNEDLDSEDGDVLAGPNEEVRQWANDLTSDMWDWQVAVSRIAEIDAKAETKVAA
jgi:hypothetical protein